MPKFSLFEDGFEYQIISAKNIDAALKRAEKNVSWENYNFEELKTQFIEIGAKNTQTGEYYSKYINLDPPVPECEKAKHNWQEPLSLVGGIESSPGVFGHGGGVKIISCCMTCGCKRVYDTWAQNPQNGIQGLESVEFIPNYYQEELNA